MPRIVLNFNYYMILQVCSVEAAKQFIEKLPANDKKISLYEVRPSFTLLHLHLTLHNVQGGYHELHNEPDGVKEKFTDECVAWAEEHFFTGEETTQARL